MSRDSVRYGQGARAARVLLRLGALLMLLSTLLVPAATARAQDDVGETDPALGYAEWPDDELFIAHPPQSSGVQRLSVYAPAGDLTAETEADAYDLPASGAHDAVAATAGHFLTATQESVLYIFRHNSHDIGLGFFKPQTTDPIAQLDDLGKRYDGGTDLFAIASGDMDGEPAADGDYRDEAVVAWANDDVGGRHDVSVAVLAFGSATEAAPAPSAITTAKGSSTINGAGITFGSILAVDTALSLAVGDFDGDGVQEAAVAYLSDNSALTIDLFRYSLTRSGATLVHTLTRVGGTTVTLAADTVWNESLSLAAGDFDGDLNTGRDELALATSEHQTINISHRQLVRMRLFLTACADNVGCSTSPNLTITAAPAVTDLGPAVYENAGRKVQIVAGVFKADPANLKHKQIAAGYTIPQGVFHKGQVRIVEVAENLAVTLGTEATTGYASTEQFLLASGGFKGARSGSDPIWSLVWSQWHSTVYEHVYLHPTTFPQPPVAGSTWASPGTYAAPSAGVRAPIVAVDEDGDGMYLGAPVHMILYEVVNLDFILQEPPKHAYWDPATAQVVNVSRSSDFNITLKKSDGTSFGTTSSDSSDWSIGGSVSASASATVKASASMGIAAGSAEASAGVSGKVAYDYSQHENEYNEDNEERTVSFTSETNKDDLIVGRLQTLHIWRYRIYGLDAGASGESAFYEIVVPGGSTDLQTEAGGLNFDWYQPVHENGNVLSYPQFVSGQTFNPPDLGSYTIPCTPGSDGCVDGEKTVREMLFPPSVYFCDGNSGSRSLDFSSSSGGGTERSSSHTLAENASVSASYKSEVRVGGKRNNATMGTEFSAEAELHNSNSWGSADTTHFKTTSSTGITLNRTGCSSLNAYAYFPIIYQTTDGSIKAMFATDPLGSQGGRQWWIDHYGQKPDLALNLPWRFYYGGSQWGVGNWNATSNATRKLMRGFFVLHSTPNAATGVYDKYVGAIVDGETARLEARVYNYGVSQGVPAGAQVRFEVAPYDSSTNRDTGPRVLIGTTTLPAMAARQMVTAAINWDTSGMSLGIEQQYRTYVTLDPNNALAEIYETESKASQFYYTSDTTHPAGGYWTTCANLTADEYAAKNCIDPAQNNEGYGFVTVVKPPLASLPGNLEDTDLSMNGESLAALNAQGVPDPNPVQVVQGRPITLRVTVHADEGGLGYAHVLVFDGDPAQGGTAIAGKQLFVGSIATQGSSVWFDWVPQRAGAHTLYAMVQETLGDKHLNNNTDTLEVTVLSPPSFTFMPVISNQH